MIKCVFFRTLVVAHHLIFNQWTLKTPSGENENIKCSEVCDKRFLEK